MSIFFQTSNFKVALVFLLASSCNAQTKPSGNSTKPAGSVAKTGNFKEGKDYYLFERVRLMDKVAFTEPAEAYSVLLPKGWTQQSAVEWTAPGEACAGTNKWLKANSADGKMTLTMNPALAFSWPAIQMQGNSNRSYCSTSRPFNAEEYLRNIYGPGELGNPTIVSVKPNQAVEKQLMEGTAESRKEMMQYGASQVNFYPSAINAIVKWADGREALLVIGVKVMEGIIPNPYDGSSSTIYTTSVLHCDVFTYPAGMAAEAGNVFVMIMSSFRSNPAWNNAVNAYWKAERTKSNTAHIGRIKMTDDQTRAMGKQAIANGQARLNTMDNQMRSWEQTQASNDRIHTNFIKTIREVENYRDETGKIELSSGFDHAWSRSDGTSFILSNNPSFDPAAASLDNRWKQMKKVD